MSLPDKEVKEFKYGYVSAIDPRDVKDGVAVDGLNWTPNGTDKWELRRGMRRLGSNAGTGKVTGLRTGYRSDGVEIPFRTRGRLIEYYDSATEDWVEIGTNSLPVAADGEDVAIESYESLPGAFVYLSSPNSGMYRIPTANPGSLIDHSETSFRGKIRIANNRTFLWDRKQSNGRIDKTGLYSSKLDKDSYGDFTAVTAEVLAAAGGSAYSGTLAFKSGQPKRSCFALTIAATTGAGTETFVDDRNGVLTSNFGGTGTINYATGAYAVTFANVTTTGNVTADYLWDDPTSGGLADFAFSSPRLPAEGFYIPRGDGAGPHQNLAVYEGSYYSLHSRKAWVLTISADDSDATNLPYRGRVGVSSWRGMAETNQGVYYIDTSGERAEDVSVRRLSLQPITSKVEPESISDLITLEDYRFDSAVVFEWGDYIVLACRTADTTENNRMFLYDRTLKLWSVPHDLQASCLDIYGGALIGGDSTTNNVFELYSGFDDDDSAITNFLTFNVSRLGIKGLKKTHRLVIEGEIQEDQAVEVWASFDGGEFVLLETISGRGTYVDIGSDIAIGQTTLGQKLIGSGDVATANHYKAEFKINSAKFEEVQLKFIATGIGYASVAAYTFKDNRYKGRKSPGRYIA